MKISLQNVGKKYQQEWVFREVTMSFSQPEKWVVKGANGSGKSTFVKVFSGFTAISQGEISIEDKKYPESYRNFSLTAPYLDLIETFSVSEMVNFQMKFRPFLIDFKQESVMEAFDLPQSAEKKYIKDFSSGMKQRVKLGLAIYADAPVLILDEPSSNLDAKGIAWYHKIVEKYCKDKLVLVCSNSVEEEYSFCTKTFNIDDFK